ncbi:hypothetical protein [Armatimonas sp.]|uniref:hypothetical protein n=1 Tax=Armatimonas sp. TaxID=1872638 RepID=UPI00286CB556|nr:hypothetical protein [Armatimonas sp.]
MDRYPLRAVPGFYGTKPGIQIGTYVSSEASDDDLQFLQQLGVEWAMLNIVNPAHHTADDYCRLSERLAKFGVKIYRIGNHQVHNVPEITLNLPGRDQKIEEFLGFLRNLQKAGIFYHTYAHMGYGARGTRRGAGASKRGCWTSRTPRGTGSKKCSRGS